MAVETERRRQAQALEPSELCFLLIRAPTDREIYGAFRAIAAHAQDQAQHEQLLIEGDVPLTAGLTSPTVPTTLQRLLNADCDMIDTLSLDIGGLSVIYRRSGGHAPFRESYFDEVRIETKDAAAIDPAELESLIHDLSHHLCVASHTATGAHADLIADASSKPQPLGESAPRYSRH